MLDSSRSSSAFPASFLFGVATADHKCEAYDPRYEDIRDVWERKRNLTERKKATDFWIRYAEDVQLAKELGYNAFRFSLAWSRLEPTPGQLWEGCGRRRRSKEALRNLSLCQAVA